MNKRGETMKETKWTSEQEELTQATLEWITGNEFGAYTGSIRSLVRWFAVTERRFQYVSMGECDKVAEKVREILQREPKTSEVESITDMTEEELQDFLEEERKKNGNLKKYSINCLACGEQLTKKEQNNTGLCKKCNVAVQQDLSEWAKEENEYSLEEYLDSSKDL